MNRRIILCLVLAFAGALTMNAQFGKLKVNTKHIEAATKTVKALTLSDEEIEAYVAEYVEWIDANNPVCSTDSKDPAMKAYADRLEKILLNAPDVKKLKLDVKVLYVIDKNAFACANGSIRVFAGLMDDMTDDELLGIIGHEVGHIVNKDTKEAFKKALLTSALKDVVATTHSAVAALTDSQLGDLGEALAGAQFSQKAEYAADDYGYEFIKRSDKDPQAMASALRVIEKMQADAGASNSKMNQLFSSHPESGKRATKLDEKYKKENK